MLTAFLFFLKNIEANGGNDGVSEGILLYPTVNEELDIDWQISGHKMRVVTINLAQDWPNIHNDLLKIIGVVPNQKYLAA